MKNAKQEIINLYSQKKVANVFDKHRSQYLFQKYKHKIESNLLLKIIKKIDTKSVKILDVACGTGRLFSSFINLEKDIEYFGIDTSEAMLSALQKKAQILNKNVTLKKADATKIPFEDEEFDVVYTFHLLWHLPKKTQKKILHEMIRVTKKNGIIIFDVLNKKFIYQKMKKFFNKDDTKGIHKLNIDEVKEIIGEKKFKMDKLNDAFIKQKIVYTFFNFINKIRAVLPYSFFHMLYFVVTK